MRTALDIFEDLTEKGRNIEQIKTLAMALNHSELKNLCVDKEKDMGKNIGEVIALETVASRANVQEVSYADGAVKINYSIAMDGGNGHESKFKCHEAPTPDFCEALAHLKRHAVVVMDLNDEILGKWARTVFVTGLTVKHKDGDRYARFSLRKKLKSGLLIEIKTPFMRDYSPHPSVIQIGDGADEDIDRMLSEACSYIAGARAQTTLFDPADVEDGEAA